MTSPISFEQLLRHIAHLFTAYGNYSFAKRAMTISESVAETLYARRVTKLPGITIPPFWLLLVEGRRQGFWELDNGENGSGRLVVMRWKPSRHESFARRAERPSRS
ncbi:hypothetical protein [Dyella flagellata]|uniref:hypothetical protein n=1 Tax=Dyella flagellata TaxID=1867833 RepID=UPI0024E0AFAA|nr:hypothetical protein [Dyella flagellata]